MPTGLLEGHFQLPAHHEPTYYPLRIGVEVGEEKLIGLQSPASRGEQMSEEELAAEIEREGALNATRGGGFSFFSF